jgi:hypothetical protein
MSKENGGNADPAAGGVIIGVRSIFRRKIDLTPIIHFELF